LWDGEAGLPAFGGLVGAGVAGNDLNEAVLFANPFFATEEDCAFGVGVEEEGY
jgi:hypothetical protein